MVIQAELQPVPVLPFVPIAVQSTNPISLAELTNNTAANFAATQAAFESNDTDIDTLTDGLAATITALGTEEAARTAGDDNHAALLNDHETRIQTVETVVGPLDFGHMTSVGIFTLVAGTATVTDAAAIQDAYITPILIESHSVTGVKLLVANQEDGNVLFISQTAAGVTDTADESRYRYTIFQRTL